MSDPAPTYDLAIIGAGPVGTEAAIRAKRAGLSHVLLDKGAMVDAIYRWPTFLTFFTTSERSRSAIILSSPLSTNRRGAKLWSTTARSPNAKT